MIEVAKDPRFGATKALLLFETPQDALRAIEGGVDIKELNIGSMAHSVGKVVVNKAIAMDQDDVETLEKLKEMGVTFDVRKVPADSKENMDSLLKKAKTELQNYEIGGKFNVCNYYYVNYLVALFSRYGRDFR